MATAGLDALIICGNQYAGFEGAVFYASGFEIVHRYVYVLLPFEGEPTLVFPREARWIGDKAKPWVKDQVWPDVPGRWIRDRAEQCRWKRVGVYGMNFIMAVGDYRELLQAPLELVPFDFEFDMARAVKSEEELVEVRDAMDIILEGFWSLVDAYEPGKTEAEIMAPAVERFFARGAGPRMMNIVLSGAHGQAEGVFSSAATRQTESDHTENGRGLPRSTRGGAETNAPRRAGKQCSSSCGGNVCQTRLLARTPLRTFDWNDDD
ncbi:MAG: hypothetical protein DMG86_07290 [Acidobacteria bacterium]|nr:MAG: hypothetical protein DMG86_07290 [Acidobacteriota bacterium]